MQLTQVPKMFSVLRKEWAPLAFCISFKLETDSDILLRKADMSLRKYKVHVVITNELATYKKEVIVVTTSGRIIVRKNNQDVEVGEQLVKHLVDSHSKYMEQMASKIKKVP